jgi:peptidylprolyl isomerase
LLAAAVLAGSAACTSSPQEPAGTTTPATPAASATAFGSEADLKALERVTVTDVPAPIETQPGATPDPSASTSPTTAPTGPATVPAMTVSDPPLSVTATTRRIITPGTGPVSAADSLVAAQLTVSYGSSGQQMDSTYRGTEPAKVSLADSQTIVGLVKGLTGVQAQSRVLLAIPPEDAYGSSGRSDIGVSGTETLLVLADVVSVAIPLAAAEGTPVTPPAGLPTVTFDPATGPTVTIPPGAAPPAETVSQVLVEGAGPALAAGDLVSVHYTGVLWKDGSVFDSSWTRKTPFAFGLGSGQVIPAWDTQLVGQKVGSRVLLVVAPKDGYGDAGSPPKISGTDTMVFVIDILGAL